MVSMTPATMMALSAGISAGGSILQARQQSSAAKIMQQRYEQEKIVAELEGLQAENERRRDLEIVLSNNKAVLGASGVGESRSFMAIQNEIRNVVNKDLSSIRLDVLKSKTAYDRAIYNTKSQSYYSNVGAIINAGSTISEGWGYHNYYLKKDEKPLGTKLKDLFPRKVT